MKKGLFKRGLACLLALVTLSACSTDILDGLIPENDSLAIIRTENATGAERLFDGEPCLDEELGFPCEEGPFPPTGDSVSWQPSGDKQDASSYPMSVEIDLGKVYYSVDFNFFNASEEQEGGALNVYAKRNLFDPWQQIGPAEASEPGTWGELRIFDYQVLEFSRYVKLEFASEADFFNISEAYFFEVGIPSEPTDCTDIPIEECPQDGPGRGAGLVP